jgi:hypothetical protein
VRQATAQITLVSPDKPAGTNIEGDLLVERVMESVNLLKSNEK